MGIAPPKHLNWYCKRCKSAFHTHRKDPKCPECRGARSSIYHMSREEQYIYATTGTINIPTPSVYRPIAGLA